MAHLRGEADGPTPPPVAAREPHPRWTPRVYAIVGPDGAGKTTIARGIVHRLAQRGIKTRIVWMRLPCRDGRRRRAIGLTTKMRHGKIPIVISVVLQNRAGVKSPPP